MKKLLMVAFLLWPSLVYAACTTKNDSFDVSGATVVYKCDTEAEFPTSGLNVGDRAVALDSGRVSYATDATTWGVNLNQIGFSSTVTDGGTTTLTAASKNILKFTGANTETVVLPVVSTFQLGRQMRIINASTGAVTIQSSGLNNVEVLAPGTWTVITCILTSGTTAASWDSRYLADITTTGKSLTISDNATISGTNTGDQDVSGLAVKANNLSDLTSASTARTNLGLGSLATQSGTFSGTSSGTNTGDQDLSGLAVKANNLSDLTSASTARTNLGLGTLATQSGTFSGTSSGTNTGDQTSVSGNAGSATALQTSRTINGTGFDGTANVTIPPYATGTSASTSATTGTMTVNMTTDIITITPTGACTFNAAAGGNIGQIVTFSITTSGTSSFTLTWGTNYRKTGTLATGTTSARFFAVTFRYVTTNTWQEIARTAVET